MITTAEIDHLQKVTLPWVEKYRPQQLDELISHKDIINTISNFVNRNALPHLLFYGPPGTGKTTTILACARRMYTSNEMNSLVLELNASDDRGIGVVREQIVNFVSARTLDSVFTASAGANKKVKLVILDEADAMTREAQNALRRVIEKYTENVRFCIICNYLSKIIPALQSRCTRFRFAPLKDDQILPRLKYVCQQENVSITPDGYQALIRLAQGDMRRVLNVLQCTALALNDVTESNVYKCLGRPQKDDIKYILRLLLDADSETAYEKIRRLQAEKAIALADIITELHEMVIKLDMSSPIQSMLEIHLANIERRLSNGCSEKLQLGAVIAAFVFARHMVEQERLKKE